ncbi:hypothetical protein NEHOM01_2509, partial [Nematocida homosporus]|uniref:uncharacterized protein n=1 Tax=Nematocida homosporus TaxID=1912981 RepID=UPI002220B3A3
ADSTLVTILQEGRIRSLHLEYDLLLYMCLAVDITRPIIKTTLVLVIIHSSCNIQEHTAYCLGNINTTLGTPPVAVYMRLNKQFLEVARLQVMVNCDMPNKSVAGSSKTMNMLKKGITYSLKRFVRIVPNGRVGFPLGASNLRTYLNTTRILSPHCEPSRLMLPLLKTFATHSVESFLQIYNVPIEPLVVYLSKEHSDLYKYMEI